MSSGPIAADDSDEDSRPDSGYLGDTAGRDVWTQRFTTTVMAAVGALVFITYLLLRGGVPL